MTSLFFFIQKRRRQAIKIEYSTVCHPVATSHELDARNNEKPFKGELEATTSLGERDSQNQQNQAAELPGGHWHSVGA
jgi:hypothetical protein